MKTLIYFIAILSIAACGSNGSRGTSGPIHTVSATSNPQDLATEKDLLEEAKIVNAVAKLDDQNAQAQLDSMKVVDLKSKQLYVVIKDFQQFQTELGSSLPTHYLLVENSNLVCDIGILSNNYPQNGQIFVFSKPQTNDKAVSDSLMIKANAINSKRIIKHLVTLECKAKNSEPIAMLSVGDLRELFKDALDIKIDSSRR